ncbi:hypothetical protein V8G54_030697 [Vigna mungo]|uniref:Uncharacterized protein n=1 Tax=Vigna mungo TaxID=3915 RepID=A0AAQ3RLI7_VIGMU
MLLIPQLLRSYIQTLTNSSILLRQRLNNLFYLLLLLDQGTDLPRHLLHPLRRKTKFIVRVVKPDTHALLLHLQRLVDSCQLLFKITYFLLLIFAYLHKLILPYSQRFNLFLQRFNSLKRFSRALQRRISFHFQLRDVSLFLQQQIFTFQPKLLRFFSKLPLPLHKLILPSSQRFNLFLQPFNRLKRFSRALQRRISLHFQLRDVSPFLQQKIFTFQPKLLHFFSKLPLPL